MTPIQQQCVNFGRELLLTCDIDPLYVMLHSVQWPHEVLGRFLLAYGMFYHAGVAASITGREDYWWAVWEAVPKAPRGTERRHFRGQLAHKTVNEMVARGAPEATLDIIYPQSPIVNSNIRTFKQIFDGAQTLVGFGPWIAFKMADIADRTDYCPVEFNGCDLSLYRDPVKGAALWRYGDQNAVIRVDEVPEVCEEIRLALGDTTLAPPLYDRYINIQEVETVLCKFKSHLNGHYPIGKDTREILHGLHGYGALADQLAACPML